MKKYATVPLRCKLKRAINSIENSGVNCKTDYSFSFTRKNGAEPAKTYHYGKNHFISILDIMRNVVSAVCALAISVLFFRTLFGIKVELESRKKAKK